jgi:uncharacterized membrane protein YdjX (TVP38/TMEM64 family)
MTAFTEAYGSWVIVIFRLSPFLSNDAISFIAGAIRMRFWRFLIATTIGIVPLIVLLAWLGESGGRMRIGLGALAALTAVLFAIYVWLERRRKKKSPPEGELSNETDSAT